MLCASYMYIYLERNGYEKIALLMILLDAAVTEENKPHIAYAESGPYLTVYWLGGGGGGGQSY